ncbi:aminoglycoside phosphotransferase family protein [Brachybacterium hainanense]|uniref:Aminoglycoside phosphotransferase family protein n=1 Tax=Brachybacterium hainanense TaxID=1541174 RepID=A0ABV6R9M7_9MICO
MSTSAQALEQAWRSGVLIPGAAAPGAQARVRIGRLGRGESFEAWEIRPEHGPALTVRVPWRDPQQQVAAMAREQQMLRYVPAGIGPRALALHAEAARSPIGAPCLVTTHVPGRVLAPRDWSEEHLHTHARLLARLHREPQAAPRSPSWSEETSSLFAGWSAQLAAEDPHALAPVLTLAQEICARAAPMIDAAPRRALCHGDLCATNIVWDGERCAYIDFEWAMVDDPARDLAIIGGRVHGGPWYVPMDEDRTIGFVREHLRALGGSAEDEDGLRGRMRAWTAYERSAMLMHLAERAGESAFHAGVLPGLRDRLTAELEGGGVR